MKIDNEKIERLMLVVDDKLRLRWERVINDGRSLLDVKRKREEALVLIGSNNRKIKKILRANHAFIIISFLSIVILPIIPTFRGFVTDNFIALVILLIPIIVGQQWMKRLDKSNEDAQKRIHSFDDVFTLFGHSFESIDCLPLSVKHGMIDEPCVINRLVFAAYGILDMKAIFESTRARPDADWYRMYSICTSIANREKEFSRIWDTATIDFDLVLSKKAIFVQAEKELKKNNEARVPAKK